MITNITLDNFKCFRHVSINPKLITVFIGPNGTGKSGVLQALLLLKQSRDNVDPLKLDGELVKFDSEALAFRATNSATDRSKLSFAGYSSPDTEVFDKPIKFEVNLEYSGKADLQEDRGSTTWETADQQHHIRFSRNGRTLEARTPNGSIGYQVLPGINSFRVSSGSGGENPNQPIWDQLSNAPTRFLSNMKTVPVGRGLTRGVYPLGIDATTDISGAKGLGPQEDMTATTLAYSRRDVAKVSRLMKSVTGVGFRTDTVPPQSARPVSESKLGDFSLSMEGFGTNALVHLLFEVVRAVPGATVLIEEPEIHLHPKAQADPASVMVEQAQADGKQLIMTTHSEHIVGRLLTSVAEETLSADELAIYSFEKDEEGVCSASEIKVNDRGQVTGGLKSFFETDLDEMRRYVDALRAKA